jgi:hypothetical protein
VLTPNLKCVECATSTRQADYLIETKLLILKEKNSFKGFLKQLETNFQKEVDASDYHCRMRASLELSPSGIKLSALI